MMNKILVVDGIIWLCSEFKMPWCFCLYLWKAFVLVRELQIVPSFKVDFDEFGMFDVKNCHTHQMTYGLLIWCVCIHFDKLDQRLIGALFRMCIGALLRNLHGGCKFRGSNLVKKRLGCCNMAWHCIVKSFVHYYPAQMQVTHVMQISKSYFSGCVFSFT